MTMASVPVGLPQFTFGQALGGGSALFFRRIGLFLFISIIFHIPLLFSELLLPATVVGPRGAPQLDPAGFAVNLIGGLLLQSILSAMLIYIVVMDLRGRPATVGQAFGRGISAAIPAVVTSFFLGLFVSLGFIALIVPGLILLVWYFVAIPVTVVERPGPFRSLSRSRFLTKGHRWSIFAIFIIYAIVSVVMSQIALLLVTQSGVAPQSILTIVAVVSLGINTLIGAYYSVIQGYGYSLLVTEKDGVDIETIARVFD